MPKHPKQHGSSLESITKQMDKLHITQFPDELEQLSDVEQTNDDEDIISSFKHDAQKEYEDVIKYQSITYNTILFLKDNAKITLTPLQKRKIQMIAYRLYEKMVIYQREVMLNPYDGIYEDLDDEEKKRIRVIGKYMNKIHDLSYALKSKTLYKKSELNIFFNNSYKLFCLITEYMEHHWKKLSTA